jgi:hypothetical protein
MGCCCMSGQLGIFISHAHIHHHTAETCLWRRLISDCGSPTAVRTANGRRRLLYGRRHRRGSAVGAGRQVTSRSKRTGLARNMLMGSAHLPDLPIDCTRQREKKKKGQRNSVHSMTSVQPFFFFFLSETKKKKWCVPTTLYSVVSPHTTSSLPCNIVG